MDSHAAPETPADDALLSVENVSVRFPLRGTAWPWQQPDMVHAVENVSFSVARNEIFGLAGESGCGKSTVARVAIGLLKQTEGKVKYRGREIGDYPSAEIRPRLQIVFQDPYTSLNPRRTVGDIVGDALVVHRNMTTTERRARVSEILARVGLAPDHYHRYPHEFSGGQRQRVAIARALVLDPEFLVLDEPTSALDVSVQAVILNLLRKLQRELGLASLFITHDLNLMRFMVDRVGVMYLGRIVEQGRTQEMFGDPLHPYTKALIASTPQPDPERVRGDVALTGELPSNINPPTGCAFHTRCPAKIAGVCDRIAPTLQPVGDRLVACHLHHEPAGMEAAAAS